MPSKLMCVCGEPAMPPDDPPTELVIVLLDPCAPPKSVCDGSDWSCDVLLDCCDSRWNCISPRGRALKDADRSERKINYRKSLRLTSSRARSPLKINQKKENKFYNGLCQLTIRPSGISTHYTSCVCVDSREEEKVSIILMHGWDANKRENHRGWWVVREGRKTTRRKFMLWEFNDFILTLRILWIFSMIFLMTF